MKKFSLALLALILPFLSGAQTFDKYEGMKEVDAVVVTSKMFKLLTKIDLNADDPETQAYIDLIENLKEMKVLSTTKENIRQQMALDVASYIKKGSMEELMRVSEDGKTVRFYYKPGKNDDYVSQLFMFMEGEDKNKPMSVILNITGEINLAQVSKLANDFKIPGGEELEKVETK
ncbi:MULTISPECIES: DUF4252 domain-containing protein [Salinimicrobium]|jgi:hypothetical protein|uniref:DUF4252 domain-containing protein n=1 Tax=Salinimicrobium profundisediminis TaxID=2994553 RepID=A0A9X3CTJ8_9FLAO|nr:DUF4252 domain-containing protein [Salinimicrobium profundisediminis]MCX2836552.1 DUF4252 domain-containing protein [Salinimicrobium profundisediminis]